MQPFGQLETESVDSTPVSPILPQRTLHRQVEFASRQLTQYALELSCLADRERSKARDLAAVNETLRKYSLELNASMDRERLRARELENAYLEMVRRLTLASAWKDQETGSHILRLSAYSRALALQIGCTPEDADRIAAVAPMHDLGKIGIPDHILHKPGPLSDQEWAIMKTHPIIGAQLLEGSTSAILELARQVAVSHHERWDGSGYPFGIKGNQIPQAARVVALADTYDALRSHRPYKTALSHAETCHIMLDGDGRTHPSHFDPHCLAAFRSVQKQFATIFSRIAEPL